MLIQIATPPSASFAQGPAAVSVGEVAIPLPPDAQVVPHPHGGGRYHGTRIRLEERLTIEVAALPDTATPLEQFVDSLVSARNVGADASRRLAAPERQQVGGRSVWVLHPACGDCESVEAFLDFPHTRVVVAWGVDGLPPLSTDQRHALAWSFVASLHPTPHPRS